MTSKNSLWDNMVENNRRRIWLWVVSGLVWFFYYPVGMAIVMSRSKNNLNLYLTTYTAQEAKEYLVMNATNWIGIDAISLLLVSIAAILCAMQGFSYLYSKKKVDFYHSVPVKKSGRFVVIYANSILIFFVPYIINLLLAVIVAGINGGLGGSAEAIEIVMAVFANLLLFLGTYALAAIAVMMTGNIIITFFAVTVFLFYEMAVTWLFVSYQSCFLPYFSYNSVDYSFLLSPGFLYYEVMMALYGFDLQNLSLLTARIVPLFFHMTALAAVLTLIAYFCYSKRPSEAAGKAMAFPKTKGIIKLLLTVPCTLGIGLILTDILEVGPDGGSNMPIIVFGLIAAVILSNCIIEVIYEQDIKAALKKKYQILVSGGCVAVIFCAFCFDLTGYGRWIPDEDKLESAAVLINDIAYGQNYWDEEKRYVSPKQQYADNMRITDIQTIRELSEKKFNGENYREGEYAVGCEVAYRMKNGRLIWRTFPVGGSEEELFNKIIGSKEYKETAYQIYDEEIFQEMFAGAVCDIIYDSGIGKDNLPPEDIGAIREMLIKDLDNTNYSTFLKEYACGVISFMTEEEGYLKTIYEYDIYPSYVNTIGYLKEQGVYKDSVPAIEDIERITVTNHHTSEDVARYYWGGYYESAVATENAKRITKDFTDEKQIEELLDALYPAGFEDNLRSSLARNQYSVTVHLKSSAMDSSYYRGSTNYVLIADRIPDWLEKETAYE